jgi:hypothetical protein
MLKEEILYSILDIDCHCNETGIDVLKDIYHSYRKLELLQEYSFISDTIDLYQESVGKSNDRSPIMKILMFIPDILIKVFEFIKSKFNKLFHKKTQKQVEEKMKETLSSAVDELTSQSNQSEDHLTNNTKVGKKLSSAGFVIAPIAGTAIAAGTIYGIYRKNKSNHNTNIQSNNNDQQTSSMKNSSKSQYTTDTPIAEIRLEQKNVEIEYYCNTKSYINILVRIRSIFMGYSSIFLWNEINDNRMPYIKKELISDCNLLIDKINNDVLSNIDTKKESFEEISKNMTIINKTIDEIKKERKEFKEHMSTFENDGLENVIEKIKELSSITEKLVNHINEKLSAVTDLGQTLVSYVHEDEDFHIEKKEQIDSKENDNSSNEEADIPIVKQHDIPTREEMDNQGIQLPVFTKTEFIEKITSTLTHLIDKMPSESKISRNIMNSLKRINRTIDRYEDIDLISVAALRNIFDQFMFVMHGFTYHGSISVIEDRRKYIMSDEEYSSFIKEFGALIIPPYSKINEKLDKRDAALDTDYPYEILDSMGLSLHYNIDYDYIVLEILSYAWGFKIENEIDTFYEPGVIKTKAVKKQ